MLNREYAEQYNKELEKMSFEKLCELKKVLEERFNVIVSFCAPDDGTSEKISMVEKAIDRANINRRMARILSRG